MSMKTASRQSSVLWLHNYINLKEGINKEDHRAGEEAANEQEATDNKRAPVAAGPLQDPDEPTPTISSMVYDWCRQNKRIRPSHQSSAYLWATYHQLSVTFSFSGKHSSLLSTEPPIASCLPWIQRHRAAAPSSTATTLGALKIRYRGRSSWTSRARARDERCPGSKHPKDVRLGVQALWEVIFLILWWIGKS